MRIDLIKKFAEWMNSKPQLGRPLENNESNKFIIGLGMDLHVIFNVVEEKKAVMSVSIIDKNSDEFISLLGGELMCIMDALHIHYMKTFTEYSVEFNSYYKFVDKRWARPGFYYDEESQSYFELEAETKQFTKDHYSTDSSFIVAFMPYKLDDSIDVGKLGEMCRLLIHSLYGECYIITLDETPKGYDESLAKICKAIAKEDYKAKKLKLITKENLVFDFDLENGIQ